MTKSFTHEDGLKLEHKIKHDMRTEFSKLFHPVMDKLDSLVGIATKNEVVTNEMSKSFYNHASKEEALISKFTSEVEKIKDELNQENKLQDKKIDSKMDTKEFWKITSGVIAVVFGLLVLLNNKIEHSSEQNADLFKKVTKIETMLEYGYSIEKP